MRAAPAVRVTVTPPTAARLAVALLAALAAAAGCAWAIGHAGGDIAWGLAGGLPGALAGWLLGPGRRAELAWDGQHWHCDGQPGRLSVNLDLHGALLLHWAPDGAGRARWLLPHRAGAGMHWHALRVALFAGRPERPADAAGQPPLTP
jgi:toxin CptA